MYNTIFAKNELMFDNFKTAVVLDIFWRLLEFDPDSKQDLKAIVEQQVSGRG